MRKITNEELGRPTPEEFAAREKMPVAVVLDNVRSAQNVGAFFRTGDAFAVECIHLCGITAVPPSREIHKSALGAETTVVWHHAGQTTDCLEALRAEGYRLLAVEQVEGACSLERFRVEPGVKYALVFGNEVEGSRSRPSTCATGRWRFRRRGRSTRSTSRSRGASCCGSSSASWHAEAPGRRTAGPLTRRAAEPSGRRAVGPQSRRRAGVPERARRLQGEKNLLVPPPCTTFAPILTGVPPAAGPAGRTTLSTKRKKDVCRKHRSGRDDLPAHGNEAARRENRHAHLV